MLVFLLLSVCYLGVWGIMFISTTFRWTFITWTFFSIMATASVALTVLSITLGLVCRFNFGKGLARYRECQPSYIFESTTHILTSKSTLISNWRMTKFNRNIWRKLPSLHQGSPFRHTLIPPARRTVITLHRTCRVVLGFPTTRLYHSKRSPAWPTLLPRYPEVSTIYSCIAVTAMAALEALAALSVLIATIHTRAPVVTTLVLDRNSAGSLNDPFILRIFIQLRESESFLTFFCVYYTVLRVRVCCRDYIA